MVVTLDHLMIITRVSVLGETLNTLDSNVCRILKNSLEAPLWSARISLVLGVLGGD